MGIEVRATTADGVIVLSTSIFLNDLSFFWDFFSQKYTKIGDFTPGFGLKRIQNDPKVTLNGYRSEGYYCRWCYCT